jgi:hypothetical protein
MFGVNNILIFIVNLVVNFTVGFEVYSKHIMNLRLNQLEENDKIRTREFLKKENITCLGWKVPDSYRAMNPHIPWTPDVPYYYLFLNVNDTVVDVEFIAKTVTTQSGVSLPHYVDDIVREMESYTRNNGGYIRFMSLHENGLDNWYLEFMWRVPFRE